MPTTATGSVNIAILDSQIIADLCAGIFYIDLSPTTFLASGADNVLGASVKVVSPFGVTVKSYSTSGYDIYAPVTDVMQVAIPTQAGNYQYGSYIITVQLTDANGTIYTIEKTVTLPAVDSKNKTRKYGSLSATMNGICSEGKVYITADTPPTYKGAISDGQVNAFTVEYPTSSGIPVLTTNLTSFSLVLFEGVYKLSGTICAHYALGDHVYAKVNYRVKKEKNIRCLLDEACIYARLAQLDSQTRTDCTANEKADTQNTIVSALRLVKTIEIAASAGFDASDYINELEDVLGCVCTCNCADGTPIINTSPAKDFIIAGCNVEKTTVGLTDSYVINNYEYLVEVAENGGILTVTAPTLDNCEKTVTFTFNIAALYLQLKNLFNTTEEHLFFESIINHGWDSLDLTCLGAPAQWDFWTYAQRSQWLFNRLCVGGVCNAEITAGTVTNTGADVTVTWNVVSGVYEVAAYLDGLLKGTVRLSPGGSFTFVGAADGSEHSWTLVAKCSNGAVGNSLNGEFQFFGCPLIATPTLTYTAVAAACPYDLTQLVGALPFGIVAEWHSQFNHLAASLVATPESATGGTYYVFAKDGNGCYSEGLARVILSCSEDTACSAPQTLLAEAITGGNRVTFQSASYPPPANSYTVKRRLSSAPDTDGSYTTIGTPTWSSGLARWQILDATAVDNTLYTYKAISNCTSSSPSIQYEFANIVCPTLTLTPDEENVFYSFVPVGGGVDKYEISVYSSDGVTLIHTDTKTPSFSNPTTGTIIYLTNGTAYKARVKIFIGTYAVTCGFVPFTTVTSSNLIIENGIANLVMTETHTGSGAYYSAITGAFPLSNGDSLTGLHGAFTAAILFTTSGSYASSNVKATLYKNEVFVECISVVGASLKTFASHSFLSTDDIRISLTTGTC